MKFLVVEVFQNSNFFLKGQKLPVAKMLSGIFLKGFPGGSTVKNLPANARDSSLFPGLGKSLGEGNGNPLHILAWEIPWTEEPGGLQSVGSQSWK